MFIVLLDLISKHFENIQTQELNQINSEASYKGLVFSVYVWL